MQGKTRKLAVLAVLLPLIIGTASAKVAHLQPKVFRLFISPRVRFFRCATPAPISEPAPLIDRQHELAARGVKQASKSFWSPRPSSLR
jgi:hypothetical protein